jgi:hypothetical protein
MKVYIIAIRYEREKAEEDEKRQEQERQKGEGTCQVSLVCCLLSALCSLFSPVCCARTRQETIYGRMVAAVSTQQTADRRQQTGGSR